MTFVYPLLLGGLALACVPILMHFLVRKKPRVVVFPAYRFLMERKASNTRNLRLRHLLLLLVRMLLVVLLCFALARPRFFHESLGLSRERPVALALIFDTTPSMEYRIGDQTRLDAAKKRALELLDELPDDCRVLVLDAAAPFGREDWLKSTEKARQRIQSLTLRSESIPVTSALAEAERRFATWDEPDAYRMSHFLCIFSDRTRASWDLSVAEKVRGSAQVLYFDVGTEDPSDLAIVSADLGGVKQSFFEGEKVPLHVVIRSTAKATNTLVVSVGDKELRQAFSAEPNAAQTLALELDAPSWGLKPGLHQAQVRLETEADSLPHNNVRFVTFEIAPRPRVLVLTDDLKRTSRFAFALECLNFHVTHQAAADTKRDFAPYEAVFLVGLKAPSDSLWLALGDFVAAGRGVCIVPAGEGLVRSAYNDKAAQAVMPASIVGVIDTPGTKWSDGPELDWTHPFLSLYRRWFQEGTADLIQSPRSATRYWEVAPFHPRGVVMRYEGLGHPAVVERIGPKQSGNVVLLTTPMDDQPIRWNNYDENLNSFYLALTLSCARHVGKDLQTLNFNFLFGQKLPIVQKSLAYPKYLLAVGESSEEIRFDEKDRWSPEFLPRAGNYAVLGTNPEEQKTEAIAKFSINIVPDESDLTRLDQATLETILGPHTVVPLAQRRSLVESLGNRWDEPIELFPWIMVALLFFLAIENALANRFYRRPESNA